MADKQPEHFKIQLSQGRNKSQSPGKKYAS